MTDIFRRRKRRKPSSAGGQTRSGAAIRTRSIRPHGTFGTMAIGPRCRNGPMPSPAPTQIPENRNELRQFLESGPQGNVRKHRHVAMAARACARPYPSDGIARIPVEIVEARVTAPFTEITKRMRRAVRNGERLHLEPEHVIALMTSEVYQELTRLEAREAEEEWRSRSGSEIFGSRGAPTGASGQSVGTTEPLEPAVENRLAAATSAMVIRQSQRKRPLPNISNSMDNRRPSTPTLKPVPADS